MQYFFLLVQCSDFWYKYIRMYTSLIRYMVYTLYSIQYTVYTIQSIQNTLILCNEQWTLYMQCIIYIYKLCIYMQANIRFLTIKHETFKLSWQWLYYVMLQTVGDKWVGSKRLRKKKEKQAEKREREREKANERYSELKRERERESAMKN